MANWNGHFILTIFGDFYPALNGDFRPPLTRCLLHNPNNLFEKLTSKKLRVLNLLPEFPFYCARIGLLQSMHRMCTALVALTLLPQQGHTYLILWVFGLLPPVGLPVVFPVPLPRVV